MASQEKNAFEPKPKSQDQKQSEKDAHKDPLSGRAGAHPVGTGVGAAVRGAALGGAAVGAAIGAAAGPIGSAAGVVAGAAVGAIGGGMAGKAIAERVNPTEEHGFWRSSFPTRPYVKPGLSYEEYAPAYEYGWESRARYQDRAFEDVESDLQRDWDVVKGKSQLRWEHARPAVRDAWNRITNRDEKLARQSEQTSAEGQDVGRDQNANEHGNVNP